MELTTLRLERFRGTRLTATTNRLTHSSHQFFAGNTASWSFDWTAPASGGPATVEFFYAGNAANDNSNTSGDEAYFNSTTTTMPLPVELSQFDIEATSDSKVKLTWQTRSESNSDYFEIQRISEDDNNIFTSIGQIGAAGDATWTIDYSFIDESPMVNQTSYYRLKQVDRDGAFDYSPIQSVEVKSQETKFSIYPNPIKNSERLNIIFENNKERTGKIQLTDMQGKVVFVADVEMLSGNNELPINLPHLALGQYLFSLEKNNQVIEMSKLLVID